MIDRFNTRKNKTNPKLKKGEKVIKLSRRSTQQKKRKPTKNPNS